MLYTISVYIQKVPPWYAGQRGNPANAASSGSRDNQHRQNIKKHNNNDKQHQTIHHEGSPHGRRLQGKPAKSGVYVNNGKKIVIK